MGVVGTGAGVVVVDRDGVVRECDASAAAILARTPEDALGSSFYADLAPNTDMPGFRGRALRAQAEAQAGAPAVDAFDWVLPSGDGLITTRIGLAAASTPERLAISITPTGPRPRASDEQRALDLARTRASRAPEGSTTGERESQDDPCAREQIHITTEIQPHGCVLAVDPEAMTVVSASSNLAEFLRVEARDALGAPLSALLDPPLVDAITAALRRGAHVPGARVVSAACPLERRAGRLFAHVVEGLVIIEIESSWGDPDPASLEATARITGLLESLDDDLDLIAAATAEIRSLTGFHRVLFHRFDEDGDGEVFTESLEEGTYEPLVGLRFPAGDIPPQARALYVRSRFRWMPDTNHAPVSLIPSRPAGASGPIDLGWTSLRSQSAFHRIYQRNLGVAAGFSASVIIDGALFGLIVGHHRRPRFLDDGVRAAVEVIARVLEARLDALLRRRAAAEPEEVVTLRDALVARLRAADDWTDELQRDTDVLRLFDAAGGILVDGDDLRVIGETPPIDALRELVEALRPRVRTGLFMTHRASAHFPSLARHPETASGVLALGLEAEGRSLIAWIRPERVHPVHWSGDTSKETVEDAEGGRVRLPRSRFRRFVEIRRGHAAPWPPWTATTARHLQSGLVDALVGHTRTLRRIKHEHESLRAAQAAFFSTVHHQLRSPLNGVLGATAQLQRLPDLDPSARDLVERLERTAKGLGSVVADVLDFTALAGGRFELRSAPFAAAELFQDFDALVAARLPADRGFDAVTSIEGELGDLIGDRDRVLQAAANLVVDVIEAAADATVELRARPRDPSGLRLEVYDRRRSLTREDQARIFDPYAAATTPTVEGLPSAGLRLPLTRALAEAMGGSLRIERPADGGVGFVLDLPLEAADRPGPPPPASHRALRVLVVDDNELNAIILEAMLRDSGHLVDAAADGAEAVTRAMEKPYDLILMDKHMPVMDGIEAMRRIRALPGENAATPIVLVSADAPSELGGGGFDGYIGKPVDEVAIERTIGALSTHR